MAITIKWSPQAKLGLKKVVTFLEEEWTIIEIVNLDNSIEKLIKQISSFPESCPVTPYYPNLRKGIIDKNNYFIYEFNEQNNSITIIDYRGTRQFPKH